MVPTAGKEVLVLFSLFGAGKIAERKVNVPTLGTFSRMLSIRTTFPALSLTCYSSNEQSRLDTDNGVEEVCRPVAGATTRYCFMFQTESRPKQIIRNCDRIYEKFLG